MREKIITREISIDNRKVILNFRPKGDGAAIETMKKILLSTQYKVTRPKQLNG